MPQIYRNFLSGTITDAPLSSVATVINSSGFASLPVVTAPDDMFIVLDPTGVGGAPEVVRVTAHTSSATSVTVTRAQQGTTARSHVATTLWRASTTASDLDELPFRKMTARGDLLTTTAANVAARLPVGAANTVLTSDGTDPAWGAITGAMITDLTVNTADLAASAVATAKIADGAVTTVKIADSAVATAKIADSAVTGVKIADGSVTSAKIADGTIVAGDLADGSVTSAKILDGTIVTADIADSAVTSAKIADGTIATGDIADGAVTSAKIADGTIVNADVATGAGIAWNKLGAPPWVRLSRTSTYQVFGPGEQDIVWDTEINDTHGYYPGSGSTITVPAGYNGIHAITATVDMTAGISANGYIKLVVNGFIFAAFQTVGNDKCSVSATVYIPAGGTIKVTGNNPSNGSHRGWIEVTRIGTES